MPVNEILETLKNYDSEQQRTVIDRDKEIRKACEAFLQHRKERSPYKRMSVRKFAELLSREFPDKTTPSRTAITEWIKKKEGV